MHTITSRVILLAYLLDETCSADQVHRKPTEKKDPLRKKNSTCEREIGLSVTQPCTLDCLLDHLQALQRPCKGSVTCVAVCHGFLSFHSEWLIIVCILNQTAKVTTKVKKGESWANLRGGSHGHRDADFGFP